MIFVFIFQTQRIKAHSTLKSLLKQKGSMRANSHNQIESDMNKKQSFPYFNELSISSIRQKNNPDQSLNFENEKQLFNQLANNIPHLNDQYGLYKATTYRGFVKRLQEERPKTITFQKANSNSRLKNFQFQQQNLCFNKQLKRKKLQSKSKQKIIQPSTQLSASRSLKQLKLTRNLNGSSKKSSQQQYKIIQAKLPIIDIRKIVNCPVIALKIFQAPFNSTPYMERNQNVKKLYHQMPDDVRLQLNDINYNLNIQPLAEGSLGNSMNLDQIKKTSSLSYSLKRSYLSKPEENRRYRNYQIYLPTSGSEKVIQVKKPLSLDCRNSSFYSTTTQQYQSPISKDSSSTATRRIARRSQFLATQPRHQQQYFSRVSNNPNRLYKRKYQN